MTVAEVNIPVAILIWLMIVPMLLKVDFGALHRLAVPIVIQVYLNAGIAYSLNRALGVPHNVACPSALIGASNFFELAVAAAIALFGFQSGAALATVVGVLVEVPVMLSVVRIVLRTRSWYQAG
jgi:ACR3 family arsenite transporter